MARGRQASKVKSKLAFLIYGEQGTWKSSMCLEFAKMKRDDGKPFRVLYIDAESGSVDDYIDRLENEGVNTENIYIIYTQSLKEVSEILKKIANREQLYSYDDEGNETDEVIKDADGNDFFPDAVVIDGTTVLHMTQQESLLRLSEKRASVKANKDNLIGDEKFVKIQNAGLEFKDWNRLKFVGNDLILNLLALNVHFAVTAREKTETISVKDNTGAITSVATGEKIPEGFKDLGYNVKTVLHMKQTEDGNIIAQVKGKDRTEVCKQGQIIEEPSLLIWQSVIDKSKDNKEFVLKNNMDKSIQKDQDIYEKELIGDKESNTQKEIKPVSTTANLVEEIRQIFTKLDSDGKKGAMVKIKAVVPEIKTAKDIGNITDEDKLSKILNVLK